MKLPVHIAAMPDLKDRDSFFDVVDFVNHTIVAKRIRQPSRSRSFLQPDGLGLSRSSKIFVFTDS
jgi:hypothetical protein